MLNRTAAGRLERSCGPSPRDWVVVAPSYPGIERIEAYFAGHAYEPHRHDTYAIGCTITGVQSFDYRGSRADSLPGDVIVLHPDEVHDGHAGAADGFRYRMLYIQPWLIQEALGGVTPLPFVPQAVTRDPRLRAALRLALDNLDDPLEPLQADQFVVALADALLANDVSLRRRPPPPMARLATETARQMIDAHFDRVVSSEELEGATGIDRYRLARHFRAHFGTSPYRYLTMRRLEQTRSLLRQGLTLAEAAVASGFTDQSHMTRQFKGAYGLPPGRWLMMSRRASRCRSISEDQTSN